MIDNLAPEPRNRHDAELATLVDRGARVRVPTRHEVIATPTAHVEGIIAAQGRDHQRGQWVLIRADDGKLVEVSERQPIPIEVEITDPGTDRSDRR